MEGLHLTADCFDCRCNLAVLLDENQLSSLVRGCTIAAGLSIMGERFHAFSHADGSAAGITGTLLLAESHVAIHTWPERLAVTLDVYVCNFQSENSNKARKIVRDLIEAFRPQNLIQQELHRGSVPDYAKEHLSQHTAMHTKIDQVIAETKSHFQTIEIVNTPDFGKVMRIDGAMMTSEKEEFIYHECLVHPAAISHGAPQTALIIGGGDGGSTEELLKYTSIEKITLCEIDEQVITLARQHLSAIHRKVFDSARVEIIHADGFAFIAGSKQNYDLILLDLTDPIAPNGSTLAAPCMSEEFFQNCYQRLSEGGSLVLHLGSPYYHPQGFQETCRRLNQVFDRVRPYTVFIPLYGSLWGMAIASKSTTAIENQDPARMTADMVKDRANAHQISDLNYYNPEVHAALFALPNYIKNLV